MRFVCSNAALDTLPLGMNNADIGRDILKHYTKSNTITHLHFAFTKHNWHADKVWKFKSEALSAVGKETDRLSDQDE